MARFPRFDLPGVPQHIVQRGNNRLPCFLDDVDRQRYLQFLRTYALEEGCDVHAYVLMANHVHMLCTPVEAGSMSRMMQALGRSYVGFFNTRHGRTGTLWEGRFKSCLVDSEGYVFACYRYIELNPVRARIVAEPCQYPWSSFAGNALGRPDALLSPHSFYLGLGESKEARTVSYRSMFGSELKSTVIEEIRRFLQQQRALGRDEFRSVVEAKTQRFAGTRPAHRPLKQKRSKKRGQVHFF